MQHTQIEPDAADIKARMVEEITRTLATTDATEAVDVLSAVYRNHTFVQGTFSVKATLAMGNFHFRGTVCGEQFGYSTTV